MPSSLLYPKSPRKGSHLNVLWGVRVSLQPITVSCELLDAIHDKSEIVMGCDGDLTCRDRNGGSAVDSEADVETGMTGEGMKVGAVDRVVAVGC